MLGKLFYLSIRHLAKAFGVALGPLLADYLFNNNQRCAKLRKDSIHGVIWPGSPSHNLRRKRFGTASFYIPNSSSAREFDLRARFLNVASSTWI